MGSQLPPLQGAQRPVFGPCLLWPNGWLDEDATWYKLRPRPTSYCAKRGPSFSWNGVEQPPLFDPCLSCPRSPISATAQLLFNNSYPGLSANLECMSEMCCTRLSVNTGRRNDAKKTPSAHHSTKWTVEIFATKASVDDRKNC